jgi:hypothetical protein
MLELESAASYSLFQLHDTWLGLDAECKGHTEIYFVSNNEITVRGCGCYSLLITLDFPATGERVGQQQSSPVNSGDRARKSWLGAWMGLDW